MPKQESKQDAVASPANASDSQSREPRVAVGMGSSFFSAAGLLAGLLGALCAFGPKFLPAQAALFEQAASRGITAGVLWGVAAVLFSLGIFSRALGRNLEVLAQTEEESPLIDQIAMDLAQTRTSMQELRVEYVYLKEHVTALGRDLPTQIAEASESATRDAMFRLAASLDQVGARLEQRIRSQHSTLESTLQEVHQALQATCEQVAQLQQSLQQQSAPPVGWDMPAEPAELGEPARPPISLGVLDHLADHSADHAADHHAADKHAPAAPVASEFGAPLPSEQVSYEEKLTQLTQLLADPRVRAAADGMTRSRGL